MSVVVFQHKRVLHTFEQGQMVWSWMFLEGGTQVVVVFGPTHGPEVGDYQLYEVKTGKLVSEVWGDADAQSLIPDWLNENFYREQIQLRLAGIKIPVLMSVLGISKPYATAIRAGRRPHPRHWVNLAHLTGSHRKD